MPYLRGIYGPLNERALTTYQKSGIDAVFTYLEGNVKDKEKVKCARERGLKVYASTWTFGAPTKRAIFGVENIYGVKSLWNETGCPNNCVVRENNLAWVRNVLENLEINGLILDGVRFPSLGSGLQSFSSCFCQHCREKAENLGYDLSFIKGRLKTLGFQDLLRLTSSYSDASSNLSADRRLQDWLEFRRQSINEHVGNVRNMAKVIDQRIEVGAAIFAPTLAPLVGQNYGDLGQILDFLQPMMYHKGDGIACINYELAKLVEGFFTDGKKQAEALKSLYKLFGWDGLNLPLNPQILVKEGLSPSLMEEEVRRAERLVGENVNKITPLFFIHNLALTEVKTLMEAAEKQKKRGIAYFAYFKGFGED
ncbi:MAG: hypothetical protein AOA66_1587 [Candidatus Bathyarchaeota archaeon BA2]|nr:MAG: hypothetical protein AOA66_1587 [Candidatus Bathyarchaeota archaeon BA2]